MKGTVCTEQNKRGSMVVEACAVLPVFVFFLMVMAGSFLFLKLEESVLYSGFQQMRLSAVEMAMDERTARISRLYLEHQIMKSAEKEMGKELENRVNLTGLLDGGMFLKEGDLKNHPDITCRIHCGFSLGTERSSGYFSDQLRFRGRAYLGENQVHVWIFPKWGERYHTDSCYVTGGERIRLTKDVAENKGYSPCRICFVTKTGN
ncbi:MAG: hypothetical protein IJ486_07730 [Firmicutes bacterium]|nr:hypothetical protein [Bacillota bacterium]